MIGAGKIAPNPYYSGPKDGHFDGTRFFSAGQASDSSLVDLLRWRLKSRAARWPRRVDVTPARPDARVDACRVTVVGHSTVLIQVDGVNILTDPIWSERASPLSFAGPRRVTAPGILFDDLPTIDVVLLSHNHYDHLDLATLRRLHHRDAPRIITPLGNDVIIRRAVPGATITAGDWGRPIHLEGIGAVTPVPANHWSARGTRDKRMALWCGFMLRTPRALIYFAGDTGYGDGAIFRQIRAEHGPPDLALIPIGAYEPRWFMAAQHANPEEAVRILLDLEARRAIGIHWGCFQLTDEPREEPAERLRNELHRRGIDAGRFVAPPPGSVVPLDG
jgi:L-ascorbate metabolism protein UlaG (beta-lactamase superfamily)